MAIDGINAANLPSLASVDEVLGNDLSSGAAVTGRVSIANLGVLIAATAAMTALIADVPAGSITMAKLGVEFIDTPNVEVRLGTNLRPTPQFGFSPALTGRINIWIGSNQAIGANDKSTFCIGLGHDVMKNAQQAYGCLMAGFRTGGEMGQVGFCYYNSAWGIDCWTFSQEVHNSSAFGAHNGTYKDSTISCFIAGTFSAFSKGIINQSVVIGDQAGTGDVSTPETVYSYSDCLLAGHRAGRFVNANGNTFLSAFSGSGTNVTGVENTGTGFNSLGSVSSGMRNAAYAAYAGTLSAAVTTANYTSSFGWGSSPGNFSNSGVFGANSAATGANQIQLGDSATTTYVYGTVQDRSDARDKIGVRDTIYGLKFIRALRPVDFRWNYRENYRRLVETEEEYEDKEPVPGLTAGSMPVFRKVMKTRKVVREVWDTKDKTPNGVGNGTKAGKRYHTGLIAQELIKTTRKLGYGDFGGVQDHSLKGGLKRLTIGYDALIGPLIKSVQELADGQDSWLKAANENFEVRWATLGTRMESLEEKVARLESEIETLKKAA